MKLLYIGYITGPFGLKGEVKILSETNHKNDIFKVGNSLYIDNKKYIIESVKQNPNCEVIKFLGIDDISLTDEILKKEVYNMVIGGDYMFKKRLTNKQMDVMNILWENDKPMAASEILKANEKLNINTIHACIRKLLEEEYVKVAYIDYSGNVMSRYFMPTVSKGKYFSESYKDIIGSKKLILTSLIETETNIEELEQLENLIRKKKEELKE